jgi:hypothetical protein
VTYSPWETLRRLPHLTLVVTRLPRGQAWWLPAEDAIVLDDRLDQVSRRCALEHELQHAMAGDVAMCSGPDAKRLTIRQEVVASGRAARQLLELDDLAEALAWALDYGEVAEALNVTRAVVRARVRSLTPAEKAYIEHRLGTGEWVA